MQNGIFKVNLANIGDAVLTAVVAAMFVALYGIVTTPGFDVLAVHWAQLGHQMLNLAIVAAFVSIGKDFFSTNSGSLLGVGPSTIPQQG